MTDGETSPPADKVIPLAEVAKHNTKSDIYMAIDGKVYDVSKFLEDHPGGPEIMMEHAGKDASQDFEDVGHSKSAREMLKKYFVGVLPADEAKAKSASRGAVPGSSSSGAGGGIIVYLIPIVAIAAAVWFQFLRPKPDAPAS